MEKRYYPPKRKGSLGTVSGFFLIIGALISIIASIFFAYATWINAEKIAQAAGATIGKAQAVGFGVTTILLICGICGMLGGICAMKRRFWGIAFLGGMLCLWTLFGLLGIVFLGVGEGEFPTMKVKMTREEKEKNKLFRKILKIITVSSIVIIILVLAHLPYYETSLFRKLYYPLLLIFSPIFIFGLTSLLVWKRRKILSMEAEPSTVKIRCPVCKQTFSVEKKPKSFKVKCPNCGKEGVIK